MEISYVKGDATQPIGDGTKIIIHVCNNIGAWGSGFVMAISARWNIPQYRYSTWHRLDSIDQKMEPFVLGAVQFVIVEQDIVVANMIGQNGVRSASNPHPLDYDALATCLTKVRQQAIDIDASVHGPRFGAGLAGGNWDKIANLTKEKLDPVPVTIYDL